MRLAPPVTTALWVPLELLAPPGLSAPLGRPGWPENTGLLEQLEPQVRLARPGRLALELPVLRVQPGRLGVTGRQA